MLIVSVILLALILLVLGVAFGLSVPFTRRGQLGEVHSPDEYGLAFDTVEFMTSDGLILRGVWIPCPGSDKAVVSLHGHGGSYDPDLYRAPALRAAGFNTLFFDFRGHGRSDGAYITWGSTERRDVLAAVDFLHDRKIHHIGLLGFSYGGIVAMVTTPDCPSVEAVVDDGGPARMRTAIAAYGIEHGWPHWLTGPMSWLLIAMASLRLRSNLFRVEAIHWVGKISPRPILFIHGDHDQYVPDFDELYAAAKEPKELWRVPDAGHTTASVLYPEEHIRRVIDFFDRSL